MPKPAGRMNRAARSADKGIDLVGDPIIFENDCQEGSQQPESPAAAAPDRAESGALQGNVHEVSGAVAKIGEKRQSDKRHEQRQRQGPAEMGPGGDKPLKSDGGEDQVVDKATRLPEAERIDEALFQWVRR